MKVLVSPGYGAGFATWAARSKALAEDPELISMVESGAHIGKTTFFELIKAGASGLDRVSDSEVSASLAFALRAYEVEGGPVYCGGVTNLEVQHATGAYRIEEYDGSERLICASGEWW